MDEAHVRAPDSRSRETHLLPRRDPIGPTHAGFTCRIGACWTRTERVENGFASPRGIRKRPTRLNVALHVIASKRRSARGKTKVSTWQEVPLPQKSQRHLAATALGTASRPVRQRAING